VTGSSDERSRRCDKVVDRGGAWTGLVTPPAIIGVVPTVNTDRAGWSREEIHNTHQFPRRHPYSGTDSTPSAHRLRTAPSRRHHPPPIGTGIARTRSGEDRVRYGEFDGMVMVGADLGADPPGTLLWMIRWLGGQ
jgi:hypothetical protein